MTSSRLKSVHEKKTTRYISISSLYRFVNSYQGICLSACQPASNLAPLNSIGILRAHQYSTVQYSTVQYNGISTLLLLIVKIFDNTHTKPHQNVQLLHREKKQTPNNARGVTQGTRTAFTPSHAASTRHATGQKQKRTARTRLLAVSEHARLERASGFPRERHAPADQLPRKVLQLSAWHLRLEDSLAEPRHHEQLPEKQVHGVEGIRENRSQVPVHIYGKV